MQVICIIYPSVNQSINPSIHQSTNQSRTRTGSAEVLGSRLTVHVQIPQRRPRPVQPEPHEGRRVALRLLVAVPEGKIRALLCSHGHPILVCIWKDIRRRLLLLWRLLLISTKLVLIQIHYRIQTRREGCIRAYSLIPTQKFHLASISTHPNCLTCDVCGIRESFVSPFLSSRSAYELTPGVRIPNAVSGRCSYLWPLRTEQ
mmetsp:Transcript_6979/g.11645  ORF Transcript_6979/g.11645 Transcript_6979/m.11645 type:complete len:202 (+) Transcript_6979:189-794(+)